jgi:hypothetical protein
MVVLRLPCLRAYFDGACCRAAAYMGKNDWNSLREPVKWRCSYASSEVVPLIRRLAAGVPLNPAKHGLEAPARFHPFAMALKPALTVKQSCADRASVGRTACFPNTVRCTRIDEKDKKWQPK